MPLDHFTLTVPKPKFEDVIIFLTSSLQHMGYKEMIRPVPYVVGFGDTTPFLWINTIEDGDEKTIEAMLKKQHVAFTAQNVEQVKEFHVAALKAGGTCNGQPGLRPHYHPGYYGAFVLDPACGLNFEVVYHKGE